MKHNGQFQMVGLRFQMKRQSELLTDSLVPEDVRLLNWKDPIYTGWPSKETDNAWHNLAGRELNFLIH